MPDRSPIVRAAQENDVPQLLQLMRGLAQFEGYLSRFAVTQQDLLERGFGRNGAPQFHAFVADAGAVLKGYALVYLIPFTFDLRPTLVLKEFFVREDARGGGLGHALFNAVMEFGRQQGVRLLRWQVLPGNEGAQKFYRTFGGNVDADWDSWVLELK